MVLAEAALVTSRSISQSLDGATNVAVPLTTMGCVGVAGNQRRRRASRSAKMERGEDNTAGEGLTGGRQSQATEIDDGSCSYRRIGAAVGDGQDAGDGCGRVDLAEGQASPGSIDD